MALPEQIRVKLSSERAEGVALTPVVVEVRTPAQLVTTLIAITGKDPQRLRDILERGTMVVSGTRYRWEPIEASESDIASLLRAFPDSEPGRAFQAGACVKAQIAGAGVAIEITREAGSKKSLFRRDSFWDFLMRAGAATYDSYSYRESADCYRWDLDELAVAAVREAANRLAYSSLRKQIERTAFQTVFLFTKRV